LVVSPFWVQVNSFSVCVSLALCVPFLSMCVISRAASSMPRLLRAVSSVPPFPTYLHPTPETSFPSLTYFFVFGEFYRLLFIFEYWSRLIVFFPCCPSRSFGLAAFISGCGSSSPAIRSTIQSPYAYFSLRIPRSIPRFPSTL